MNENTGNGTYNGHAKGQALKQQVGAYVHDAVDGIREAAQYMRANDFADIRDDVAKQVRAHPLLAVAVGLGFGYLIGRIIK